VCHIAIDAGYRLAWVGYLTHDAAKTVAPVASAGLHRDYPQRHRFSWDAEQPEGRGLIGRAIRQRRSASANDLRTEPDIEPWREEALAQGFRSGIVLPLLAEDTVLGVLALYRGELYDYSTDECALLMQLVNDLSFGILSRRTQSAREEAEEALRKSEAQYRNLIETAQEGIWMVNRDMVTTYTNQRTAAMLGYTVAEVVGRSVLDLIPPELHAEMEEHIAKRRQGVREVYEFRFRRKDGSDIWVLVSGSPLYDDAGQFAGTFAMLTDITERHQAEAYQREFARKTIEAATGGKLIISDRQEIARLAGPALASWEIRRSDDLAMIRHAVAAMVCAAGMPEDRVHDFMLCISEAATNACKHAGGGRCSLHRTDDTLFAVVSDDGPGILAINLPELALQHGYTTAVSLGMGYKAMISLADHVYLATGPDGTVVGIRMALHAPAAPTQVFPGVADVW